MNMAQQQAALIGTARELYTESLRLTAFLAPSTQVGQVSWWTDLVGSQPETKTEKPNRGEWTESGSLGDSTLTLSVQPGRADWFLTQRVQEGTSPEVRWAGRFPETLGIFLPLMNRWLGISPGLVRLAFASVVHEPVRDKAASYRKLQQYLPSVHLDPDNSEDFLYQINRPRISAVIDHLKINRLSRWSAAVFIPVRFVLQGREQVVQQQVGTREHTCRIDLDISTDSALTTELPAPRLPELLNELQNIALELVTRGDIA